VDSEVSSIEVAVFTQQHYT